MKTIRTLLVGFACIFPAVALSVAPSAARAQAPALDVVGTWRHEAGYASTTLVFRADGSYSCTNVDRLHNTRVEDRGTWVKMAGTIFTTDSAGLKNSLYVFPINPNLATFRVGVAPFRFVDLTFGRMR